MAERKRPRRTRERIIETSLVMFNRLGEPNVTTADIADEIANQLPEQVYLSWDIDGLDPTLCPGTGTPVPGGLSWNEAIGLLRAVRRAGKRIVGLDLCEVAPGDTRLVAYVVLVEGPRPDHAALRDFLGAHLPDYMVPATFVALDELPLDANGKVDRASLPAPDPGTTIGEEEFVAPRTPLEERIAEILADLLHLERVGVLDNFFMLGGHSLLGTQLIARLREVFGVEMELRTLFDRPTVAGLGGEVERLLMEKLEAMGEEEVERRLRAAPTGSPSST